MNETGFPALASGVLKAVCQAASHELETPKVQSAPAKVVTRILPLK
jgi:hypothetical protein